MKQRRPRRPLTDRLLRLGLRIRTDGRLGLRPEAGRHRRKRLTRPLPAIAYAIGDVHGRLDLLLAMERLIASDANGAASPKLIILLGDCIDKGPSSAAVIDHLLLPPPAGFERLCVAGNHEQMMLDFLDRQKPDSPWLRAGGTETLMSYGIDVVRGPAVGSRAFRHLLASSIPENHVDFLRNLPITVDFPGFTFVHAGPRPGIDIALQSDEDLMWYRPSRTERYDCFNTTIVHGHTREREPLMTPRRICLDLDADASGRLAAVRISSNLQTNVLTVML